MAEWEEIETKVKSIACIAVLFSFGLFQPVMQRRAGTEARNPKPRKKLPSVAKWLYSTLSNPTRFLTKLYF